MPDCHTLVVSDIHLGSKVCRTDKILELLNTAKFKTLVINGDLFDRDTTHKLDAGHWNILSAIASLAERHKVLLVGGNHGRKLDVFVKKMGIEIRNDYSFSVGQERFLCLHGDEFDMFVKHLPLTTKFFTSLYEFLQKFGGEKQRSSMLLKRVSKHVLRVPVRQQRMALRHAAGRQASVIICSHTHLPHQDTKDGILFINSGSFCENPCNYITISRSGRVELCEM